ncbi:uncharacterized protein GGS22DRAFT_194395 [Annulohypoxylon maeteangense]|uniref:uncharacterized protein n=1 Tax=Annulohypoxylon maeteangense TaxID=1927788 RepID=UPI0020078665|nr:uncharacterized protein GGS22DRAFT_194395 [Annulohypoxylon maeteangense]KAI0890253.1 hypothetical protein GGS22DRAFT_194395 [Annulohypoxylon maeteangense]
MSASDRFMKFSALPPELRLQVWAEALSVRTVCAVTRNPAGDHAPIIMAYVGPAPYLAGLSCKEARRVLKQTHVMFSRGPNAGVHWVNMDQTVIYLGNRTAAVSVLDGFRSDDLSRFKHVALLWDTFDELARLCMRLAKECPSLCTIIIHEVVGATETGVRIRMPRSQPLTLEAALYYASILAHTGSELGHKRLDTNYFRSLLLEYFDASRPRIHLLPSNPADAS